MALPETGLVGAVELAERIRVRIEALSVPRLDGKGTVASDREPGGGVDAWIGRQRALFDRGGRRGALRGEEVGKEPGQRGARGKGRGASLRAQGRRAVRRMHLSGREARIAVRVATPMQESVPVRSNWRSTLFSLIAMGILDDAIRQHLDLKRQHGAAESELKHLEDEAFGPPSRPGRARLPRVRGRSGACGKRKRKRVGPDGGESGEDLAASGEGSPAAEAPVAEHPIVDEAPEPAEVGETRDRRSRRRSTTRLPTRRRRTRTSRPR